jgi:hypothetical protein
MSNVFERARAIRMYGEPWQNAVQRAGSQLRYEGQVAGGKTYEDGRKKHVRSKPYPKNRHSPTTSRCRYNEEHNSCRLSNSGRKSPERRAYVDAHPAKSPKLRAAQSRFATFASEAKGKKGKDVVAHHIRDRYAKGTRSYTPKSKRGGGDYDMDGGAKKHGPGRRTEPTDLCYFSTTDTRCHRSAKARREHPRAVRPATERQQAARDAFAAAARATKGKFKGKGSRDARNDAVAAAIRGHQQGGGDGYSDTSSTRSSDFTSVSDTTSYSQSGGSWTSNDSSSLW